MGAIAVTDEELPANCAQVCYFIQFFDEHGNPSPLSDLGCVTTTSKVDLPVPILGQPVKGRSGIGSIPFFNHQHPLSA